MYWDCSGKMLKCLNGVLQESLELNPLMILTAFFWSWKICKLYEELPPKNYSIIKKGVKVGMEHAFQCIQRYKWSNTYKYRISWPIRHTFSPKKCDLNSNCVLSKVRLSIYFQTYINTRTSISDTSSENNCEDDFSGGDDDFLGFYDE
jgi:hypothetical protein